MPTKSIKFRAFKVKNDNPANAYSNMLEKIIEKLHDSTVEKRMMEVSANEDDKKTYDLISEYIPNGDDLWMGIMRISPKKEMPTLPENFMTQTSISFDQLRQASEQDNGIICTDFYYVYIHQGIIITNLRTNVNIRRFNDYINWFLGDLGGNANYEIQTILASQELHLNQISKIVFGNENSREKIERYHLNESNNPKWITKLAKKVMTSIGMGMPTMNAIAREGILSAQLTLTFKKPSDMMLEDYNEKLSSIITPMADASKIRLFSPQGGLIKGEDLPYTISIDVEVDEATGLPEREDLFHTMKDLAHSLNTR